MEKEYVFSADLDTLLQSRIEGAAYRMGCRHRREGETIFDCIQRLSAGSDPVFHLLRRNYGREPFRVQLGDLRDLIDLFECGVCICDSEMQAELTFNVQRRHFDGKHIAMPLYELLIQKSKGTSPACLATAQQHMAFLRTSNALSTIPFSC